MATLNKVSWLNRLTHYKTKTKYLYPEIPLQILPLLRMVLVQAWGGKIVNIKEFRNSQDRKLILQTFPCLMKATLAQLFLQVLLTRIPGRETIKLSANSIFQI